MNVRADIQEPGTLRTEDDPRRAAVVARDPAAGGSGEIQFTVRDSSLGCVLVARSARGLCAVLLGDGGVALERDLRERFPHATVREGGAELNALAAEVAAFVESPARPLDVPLDLVGTAFQRSVWDALREIPAGQTASYTEIAARIGRPRSVRAVAQACAANALAVVVPCHRVLRSDGGLSGYRWGVERKRSLLDMETVA